MVPVDTGRGKSSVYKNMIVQDTEQLEKKDRQKWDLIEETDAGDIKKNEKGTKQT
jgi:hypothetical protein